jgi:hypothetical protein
MACSLHGSGILSPISRSGRTICSGSVRIGLIAATFVKLKVPGASVESVDEVDDAR